MGNSERETEKKKKSIVQTGRKDLELKEPQRESPMNNAPKAHKTTWAKP